MAKGKYEYWLTADGLLLLEGWARDGLTDEQIAHNVGIKRSTLSDWKDKYPDISDTLKRGKEIVDIEVENALLKRALGFQYDEVTSVDGEETKRVTKMVVPDTTAQIFWLKNRRPDKYRDKPEPPKTVDDKATNLFDRLKEIDTEGADVEIREIQQPPDNDDDLVEDAEVPE